MSAQLKLGIFDSGIGGLSVANFLIDKYPSLQTSYLADSLFLPYGTQAEHVVRDRVSKIMRFFLEGNFTHIICACNTAYALAGDIIDQKSEVHISNVTQALIHTLPSRIDWDKSLLIATPNTIKSGIYQKYLGRIHGVERVHISANSRLVELIEENGEHKEAVYSEILSIAQNCRFKPQNIILGCTHYNWAEEEFQKVFPSANIYGSTEAFSFPEFEGINDEVDPPALRFFDTGMSSRLAELVDSRYKLKVEHLSLEGSAKFEEAG